MKNFAITFATLSVLSLEPETRRPPIAFARLQLSADDHKLSAVSSDFI
jgi:hypothetical protein